VTITIGNIYLISRAEEFEYESEKGFLNVHCTVWGEDRGLNSVPVPIGKVFVFLFRFKVIDFRCYSIDYRYLNLTFRFNNLLILGNNSTKRSQV
jgi:hypothetical protein